MSVESESGEMSARLVFLILVTVWAGMIIGVSLIATPIKFQAPSLSMQTGLEVGRYTFRFFVAVELCLLIASITAAGFAQPRRTTIAILAFLVIVIAVQRLFLLPFLDHRVSEILAGAAPSFSIPHKIYAGMEVAKAALLITSAVVEYNSQLG